MIVQRLGPCLRLLVVASGLWATPAAGQRKPVLEGRVLAGDRPVADLQVSLHRVTSTGGTTLGTDTTDENGRFTLTLDGLGGEAVLFVATRYEGELYIGEPIREVPTGPYLVKVGPGATPIDLTTTPTAQPTVPAQPDNPRAGLMVIVVSVLALSIVFGLAARPRVPAGRRLLVEIAELDNRHAASPLADYEQQRAELLRRLHESA